MQIELWFFVCFGLEGYVKKNEAYRSTISCLMETHAFQIDLGVFLLLYDNVGNDSLFLKRIEDLIATIFSKAGPFLSFFL